MFGKRSTPHPETCERCPHRYSEQGCPAWIGAQDAFMETNVQTGDIRAVVGCFYHVIPKLMVHVVQAANRTSSVAQEWRNDLVRGLAKVATAIGLRAPEEAPQLEQSKDGSDRRSRT